jgi:hypothetical protein
MTADNRVNVNLSKVQSRTEQTDADRFAVGLIASRRYLDVNWFITWLNKKGIFTDKDQIIELADRVDGAGDGRKDS